MGNTEDPWQALLHHLRQQTGIQPTPLSRAERESGMLSIFAPELPAPAAPAPPSGVTLAEQGVSLQHLLDYLREQTGIKPIPLSLAERQSGMLQALGTGGTTTPTVAATAAPQSKPAASPASRQELLQRLQVPTTTTAPAVPSPPLTTPAPSVPHSPVAARHIAAYRNRKG
ncbi:MAG: hypothetical protein HQM04_12805 [Magnetococcales bacterium]|nr:hypothetical protein [Magnetococcales bacterium]MBF0115906.1 hypothetical protein [Magnetococcales bacterium]